MTEGVTKYPRSRVAMAQYTAASTWLTQLPGWASQEDAAMVLVFMQQAEYRVRRAWAEDMGDDHRSVSAILDAKPAWCVDQVRDLIRAESAEVSR